MFFDEVDASVDVEATLENAERTSSQGREQNRVQSKDVSKGKACQHDIALDQTMIPFSR